jgi:hypothetical protein
VKWRFAEIIDLGGTVESQTADDIRASPRNIHCAVIGSGMK